MKNGDIVMVTGGRSAGRFGRVYYVDPAGRVYITGTGSPFSVKKEWVMVCEGEERRKLEDWMKRP